jgi:hypothetical protein
MHGCVGRTFERLMLANNSLNWDHSFLSIGSLFVTNLYLDSNLSLAEDSSSLSKPRRCYLNYR